ncbi:MAG TPA: type VI secretion system tube protein Hcp [Puia sp.]|nr:type VI secretion system tube protein Hcp [Puia sp.]
MKKQLIHLAATTCLILVISVQSRAQSTQQVIGSIAIEGAKQGEFTEGGKNGKSIPIIGFEWNVQTPRDQATGMASGKRQYSPIVIVKNIDVASAQFFQAVTTNEALKTVVVTLEYADGGKMQTFQTLRLTNAIVVKVSQFEGAGAPGKLMPNYTPMEEVSISFQKIEIETNKGKTIASDDWTLMK